MQHKTMLIMAGGTGGHVFPALAVADYLRLQGIRVYWLGTLSGLEARIVPENGYELLPIRISGVRGKGILKWLYAPFMLLINVLHSILLLHRIKPDAVLGMGGFVSAPGGIAAWLTGIPLFIHEQNSILGLTNRLLAPFARVMMEGFPGTFKTGNKVRTTGNPVRRDLVSLAQPDQRLSARIRNPLHLLVIGGSQGARILNRKIPDTLKILDTDTRLEVMHQAGERNYTETVQRYEAIKDKFHVRIEPFIDNMVEAYTWADIVLCRAGALTIAEICAVGIASILVPFPHAVDDHQTTNARFLSDSGCAILLPEPELEAGKLAEVLNRLINTREAIVEMARLARSLAKPESTRLVGDICLEHVYA